MFCSSEGRAGEADLEANLPVILCTSRRVGNKSNSDNFSSSQSNQAVIFLWYASISSSPPLRDIIPYIWDFTLKRLKDTVQKPLQLLLKNRVTSATARHAWAVTQVQSFVICCRIRLGVLINCAQDKLCTMSILKKNMNIYCSVNNQPIKKPSDSAVVGMLCNLCYYYSIM